jgi:hypothetical protein
MGVVNTAAYHESNYRLVQALGAKLTAGNFTFEPVGFGGMYLLIKQFPLPFLSGGDAIESPEPGGGFGYVQGPIRTAFEGQVGLQETESGIARQFLVDVIRGGGYFDARIYEGTPGKNTGSYSIEQAFMKIEPPDIDWENRTQLLLLTGSINYRFFGKTYPGNS